MSNGQISRTPSGKGGYVGCSFDSLLTAFPPSGEGSYVGCSLRSYSRQRVALIVIAKSIEPLRTKLATSDARLIRS